MRGLRARTGKRRRVKPRFRPSLAQTRRLNQQALDYYRALSPNADAPHIDLGAKPAKTRATPNPDTSEGPVLAAISQLLARHPKVHIAIRHNSGAVVGEETESSGRRFVWFNRIVKGRGVLVDFTGTLTSGRPFAIEAKAPGWKMPGETARSDSALRARQQALYLEHVRTAGGVAGFARSVDEALAVLEG